MASRIFGGRAPRHLVGVVLGAVFVAAPVASADIVIDDFTEAPGAWPVVLSSVGSQTITETGLANVIGGKRVTTVTADDLDVPGLDKVIAAIAPGRGLLDFNTTAGADGAITLLYESIGGLNLDLTGEAEMVLDVESFDYANNVPLIATLTLSDGLNSASGSLIIASAGAQAPSLSFASFTNIGALDLTDIDAIMVSFDAGFAADFRLREIRTVIPAPGGLAVLTVALAAPSRRRRR